MRKLIFRVGFLCFIIFSVSSYAKPKLLLISDIDDTIRNTHSRARLDHPVHPYLGLAESGYRQLFSRETFTGMKDLYRLLVDRHQASVYYVTGFHLAKTRFLPKLQPYFGEGYEWVQNFSEYRPVGDDFIRQASFPIGPVLAPVSSQDRQGFKERVITDAISELQPDVVILIGDNADNDSHYYDLVASNAVHSTIHFMQFVRQSNSSESKEISDSDRVMALLPSQVGFVTPVEISLTLYESGILSQTEVNELLSSFLSQYQNESFFSHQFDPKAFPSWMNCSDFKWHWTQYEPVFQQLEELKTVIFKHCRP